MPTTQSLFDDDVANNAISTAKSIKENAFIYSIGLSAKTNTTIVGDDGDGNWTETEKFNAYYMVYLVIIQMRQIIRIWVIN